jgi:hypothetical protein
MITVLCNQVLTQDGGNNTKTGCGVPLAVIRSRRPSFGERANAKCPNCEALLIHRTGADFLRYELAPAAKWGT